MRYVETGRLIAMLILLVLYLGVSDTPAWVITKANQYARDHGLAQFVSQLFPFETLLNIRCYTKDDGQSRTVTSNENFCPCAYPKEWVSHHGELSVKDLSSEKPTKVNRKMVDRQRN